MISPEPSAPGTGTCFTLTSLPPWTATNNRTRAQQRAFGTSFQSDLAHVLAGHENRLIAGVAFDGGWVDFASSTELARLTETRGTQGSGRFDAAALTEVDARTWTAGAFVLDAFRVTGRLTFTLGGRLSHTRVTLRDRRGTALDGDPTYTRFNPGMGLTYETSEALALYAGYGVGHRAPSPVELTCADPGDPCRLPNGFQADPPLQAPVATATSAGLRGLVRVRGRVEIAWSPGTFLTDTHDDILFVSAGPGRNSSLRGPTECGDRDLGGRGGLPVEQTPGSRRRIEPPNQRRDHMKNVLVASVLAVALLTGCAPQPGAAPEGARAGTSTDSAGARTADCTPLETRPREAPDREPAFPGQTRTCGVRSDVAFDVAVLTTTLESPWAIEPLPGGALLVTEKPGGMRRVSATGEAGPPIAGVPAVDADGQGGLLDVALSPGFASDRTIFWSFTEPREGGNGTSVARGVLSEDGTRLDQVQVILRTQPTYDNNLHYGSRITFATDGTLFVTVGERSDARTRHQAQQLDSHFGKVLRIQPDGSPAPGNPFVDQAGALPEIWSFGHRNPQAAALDAEGRLWVIEHGPRGGDEVNLAERGKNYGWPLLTYGIDYSGGPLTYAGGPASGAETQRAGMEQPVYFWDPVIAPSGAQFYSGDAFPAWRGSLFVGALRGTRLVRLVIENDRVVGEEHLLADRGQRVRDVRQGPDGALYVVTDGGELWRITPRG